MSTLLLYFSSLAFFLSLNVKSQVIKSIYVDINGYGNYKSIQEAINAIPFGNQEWTLIKIKAGVYKEKVTIPIGKGFVKLEGDGSSQTSIEWDDFASQYNMGLHGMVESVFDTGTLTVLADNVVLKGLTIKNLRGVGRAVALLLKGDKIAVYKCSFIGVQDTLCDMSGRHYIANCYIEGAVDFIWGMGQSIYEYCTLSTVPSGAAIGWVTAHQRSNSSDSTGFVFKKCRIVGKANTYLGRILTPESRVIFYNSWMDSIVVPEGWDANQDPYSGSLTTYVEILCSGPGSDTSRRVKWEKKGNILQMGPFISRSYIDDGWISQQPR